MRLRGKCGAYSATRVRRASLVLLLLTLHAAQSSATHFHRLSQTPVALSARAASVGETRQQTQGGTGAGLHAECLLCQLQRTLSSGLANSAPDALAPPKDFVRTDTARASLRAENRAGVVRGRAPPLA